MFTTLGIDIKPSFRIKRKALLDPNQQPDPSITYREGINDADITASYLSYQTDRLIEEFKETTSAVSDVSHQDNSMLSRIARPYELPDGFNTVFSSERIVTTESLFKPFQYPLPGVSLPEGSVGLSDLIIQSLSKADLPHETVKILLNNVIISGGTTLLKGFADRLNSDLASVYPAIPVRILQQSSPIPQRLTVWTGASILASLGHYEQMWISKQEYEEFGSEIVERKFK